MTFHNVALCTDCWERRYGPVAATHPARQDLGQEETCGDCQRPTRSGIYLRMDDGSF